MFKGVGADMTALTETYESPSSIISMSHVTPEPPPFWVSGFLLLYSHRNWPA